MSVHLINLIKFKNLLIASRVNGHIFYAKKRSESINQVKETLKYNNKRTT